MKNYLIISGSPRSQGKSSFLAKEILLRLESAGHKAVHFSLAEKSVSPCSACDACKNSYTCIIEDDMQELYELLDECDELMIVSPVFFAGPPAQFKAVCDRMQSYYWSSKRQESKKPLSLYVIGEGGDPHGFEPLVTIVKSSMAVAGFNLECIYNGVGMSLDELVSLIKV